MFLLAGSIIKATFSDGSISTSYTRVLAVAVLTRLLIQ